MRKWIVRLVILAVLVGLGFALEAWVFAPKPVVVELEQLGRGTVESTVTNSKAGTVKARRRAKLSPGTSGIVVGLEVSRGQRIEAGDVVLRLNDDYQRAELVLAEKAMGVARATHGRACLASERARRELDRNRQLAARDIVSEDGLDSYESAYELAVADCSVAEAEVERSQAAVDVARAALDKTVLIAPFDGVVAEVSVELGEWVTPSVPLMAAPDLVDVIDSRSLYVSAPMDEVDAALLKPGQVARVTIDSFPGREFPAHVVRVAPYVLDLEQQNRTLEVEVELDDEEFSATLLPGTSADVEIILQVKSDVPRLAATYLLEGGLVLVVEDGVLAERELELGLRNWNFVEVLGGLTQGESFVVNLDDDGVEAGASVARGPGPAP